MGGVNQTTWLADGSVRIARDGASSTILSMTDPRLIAIKARLLEVLPELTGRQINAAALHALLVVEGMK